MKGIMFLLIMAIFTASANGDIIFSDDFESGTLDQWTIGGRQQGINIAEVVNRYDSQMAHLHHKGLTEITIEKTFDYDPNLTFSFDMELDVTSWAGPTDDDYAMGGVYFDFLDESGRTITRAAYVRSTSSWPFTHYNCYFDIGDSGGLHSYTFNAQDILSGLDVDTDAIASVWFWFRAYCSGTSHNLTSDIWVDNITVELPVLAVAVDIKPGSCPNPLNARSRGVLPVAILGAEDFDVNEIDVASIRLAGVSPIRSNYEDVATPVSDGNECDCSTEGPDGYTDLTLKFRTQQIVEELVNAQGELADGDVLVLDLRGCLVDGTLIGGQDCIILVGNASRRPRGDINVDGVVDFDDFAIMAGRWLEFYQADRIEFYEPDWPEFYEPE